MRNTLSVLVENKPGVLTRVCALFARRSFNIHSLAVGETENPKISRITLVVDAEKLPLDQIYKQLNKLINVLKIVKLEQGKSVKRQLLMIKVKADDTNRANVLQIVELFRSHVVDVCPKSVVIESVGTMSKLEALLVALEPYGIREIVQSGVVAMSRGYESITDEYKEDTCFEECN